MATRRSLRPPQLIIANAPTAAKFYTRHEGLIFGNAARNPTFEAADIATFTWARHGI